MEIKLLEISGFVSVLTALRLPYGLPPRSEIDFNYAVKDPSYAISTISTCNINNSDIQLLKALIKRGDEQAKVIRGLTVCLQITAPRYWWVEMDTYTIGTTRLSSESTMHIQGKDLTTEELVEMKSNLKEGTLQTRIQIFNYQTLRRIYHQRYNHRLPEWRKFCEFVFIVPFAKELILAE